MAYYGYQPEQTKAQIRSTRGETIDLALPIECTVGELRHFLIDEYNYDPNTRLLYNGLIADDNSCVCDYPYGSLMIATPADMQQSHRQPLPPRQAPTQQQQQQQPPPSMQQQRLQEPARTSPHTSPRPASGSSRKNKATEAASNNNNNNVTSGRRTNPAEAAAEGGRKNKSGNTVVKHQPKRSPRVGRSTSAESNNSDGRSPKAKSQPQRPPTPPAPVDASSSPATRDRLSPNNNTTNSGRAQGPNKPSSGRNASAVQEPARNVTPTAASAAPPQPSPTPPQPPTAAMSAEEEELNHRQRTRFTVECQIPSLQRVVHVDMNGESSVVDLILAVVAEAPEIGGQAQVVFRGRVLPQNVQAKLFDLGMRADTRVFIAAGEFSNPETITLLEVEKDTTEIERAMQSPLTDLQRKGFYEELMRILFRTDSLQSLEGEWRQRRKDAVKKITSLQDALNVEGKKA